MSEPFYSLESLQPENSVSFLVKRCGVMMAKSAERRFESWQISFNQWLVLIWLAQRPHASATELGAHLGHDLGALTRVVDALERRVLVRRVRSRHDRRAVEIAITPEGRRVAHAGKRLMVDLQNEILAPYSKVEVEMLIAALQRLLSRLQDADQLATPSDPRSAAPSRRGSRRSARVSRKTKHGHLGHPESR